MKNKAKIAALIVLTIILFIAVFSLIPRTPQDVSYHQFADARKIVGIPNFGNVISNFPFILVGIIGFFSLNKQWGKKNLGPKEATVFLTLFAGILLTGIGSTYYHWSPDNLTLLWDRLPMTLVFMSLLTLTIMKRIDYNLGFDLLIPLIIFGFFSVLYWHWTELSGQGDLRLYMLTQFYSIFLILLILVLFPKSDSLLKIFIGMLIFYALAKLCEYYDATIFHLNRIVSGHTLKHFFAAISTYGGVIILNSESSKKANH